MSNFGDWPEEMKQKHLGTWTGGGVIVKQSHPPLAPDETKLLKHRGLCRLRCWYEGHYAWQVELEDGRYVLTCNRCDGRRVL